MKWSYLLLFLIITLVGCEGVTPLDPDPVVRKVTISASVKGNIGGVIDPSGVTEIELGGSKIYNVKPYKDYILKSVKINGVEQTISGNTVELKDVFSGKTIEVEFIHKDKFNIQDGYWNLKGLKQYLDGVLVRDAVLDEEILTNQSYFYSDGVTKIYRLDGTLCGGPFNWEYIENPKSIKIHQTVFTIIEITPTRFSYKTSEITPLGQTLESVNEYKRDPKN